MSPLTRIAFRTRVFRRCRRLRLLHRDAASRVTRDIVSMPRGGPDASWLDRRLHTNRLQYLDRDDVDDLKQRVIHALDRRQRRRFYGAYGIFARMALGEVADIPSPEILELGSGLGGLSRKLLEYHPTAQVTVTDIEPTFVADIAASDLGRHPRATVREMDATAIDVPNGHYDLAVFAMSLSRPPPELAARVFVEGTRAANKLLIVDARRPPAPAHLAALAVVLPFTRWVPLAHDGFVTSLRAYSPSALRTLAYHADPAITVEFCTRRFVPMAVVASRAQRPGKSAQESLRHRDNGR